MYTLTSTLRNKTGKGVSRRERELDLLPAIVYGKNLAPVAVLVEHNKVVQYSADDSFFLEPITLVIDGKEEQVKMQEVQRHAYKPKLLHLDFIRV